jgi:three-Cys-motif partner protein
MIPDDYIGKEHTFLKHLILKEYLEGWSHKMASISKYVGKICLFYVDCFSGPWKSSNEQHSDTSIYIALHALNEAQKLWIKSGYNIETNAIFIEKNKKSFDELESLVTKEKQNVKVFTFWGEFGNYVQHIQSIVNDNPVLLFVDPTGWKGASMKYIAPLVNARFRDVIINVMFDHINRFKDAELKFIRQQMEDFFQETLQPDLSQEDLMSLYRKNIKNKCRLIYSADLIIPHPTKYRTKYRLVVGGNHPEVIRLFRDIESKVTGSVASVMKAEIKDRKKFEDTGQFKMELGEVQDHTIYEDYRLIGLHQTKRDIKKILTKHGKMTFEKIWPLLLERNHITLKDLKNLTKEMLEDDLIIQNKSKSERSIKDCHILELK